MKKAPILVTVHTRFDHFKSCINSLLRCPEAKYTNLFISSDFQRNEEEKVKVDLIRNYVKTIKGFKSVTPIFFKKNVGIEYASHYSVNKVFENYDQIIMLEDDVEVSPFFLNYINRGLDFYKNDTRIFSICGFSPFILRDNYTSENILCKNHVWNAWGFGTWKSKFSTFRDFRDSKDLLSHIKLDLEDRKFRRKLDDLSLEHFPHLFYSLRHKVKPEFDYLVGYYCLKNNFFNIYPSKSYTKNNGNDGRGLRAKKNTDISLKMKNEILFNEVIQFENFENLEFRTMPHYSRSRLVIFIKKVLIRFKLFKFGKFFFNFFTN